MIYNFHRKKFLTVVSCINNIILELKTKKQTTQSNANFDRIYQVCHEIMVVKWIIKDTYKGLGSTGLLAIITCNSTNSNLFTLSLRLLVETAFEHC